MWLIDHLDLIVGALIVAALVCGVAWVILALYLQYQAMVQRRASSDLNSR